MTEEDLKRIEREAQAQVDKEEFDRLLAAKVEQLRRRHSVWRRLIDAVPFTIKRKERP